LGLILKWAWYYIAPTERYMLAWGVNPMNIRGVNPMNIRGANPMNIARCKFYNK